MMVSATPVIPVRSSPCRRALAATARRPVEELLRSFAGPGYRVDNIERAALAESITSAMLLRAAIDPPSEIAWHAPNVPRLVPLIDDPGDPSKLNTF